MIEELDKIVSTRLLTSETCRFFLSDTGLLMTELSDGSYRGSNIFRIC